MDIRGQSMPTSLPASRRGRPLSRLFVPPVHGLGENNEGEQEVVRAVGEEEIEQNMTFEDTSVNATQSTTPPSCTPSATRQSRGTNMPNIGVNDMHGHAQMEQSQDNAVNEEEDYQDGDRTLTELDAHPTSNVAHPDTADDMISSSRPDSSCSYDAAAYSGASSSHHHRRGQSSVSSQARQSLVHAATTSNQRSSMASTSTSTSYSSSATSEETHARAHMTSSKHNSLQGSIENSSGIERPASSANIILEDEEPASQELLLRQSIERSSSDISTPTSAWTARSNLERPLSTELVQPEQQENTGGISSDLSRAPSYVAVEQNSSYIRRPPSAAAGLIANPSSISLIQSTSVSSSSTSSSNTVPPSTSSNVNSNSNSNSANPGRRSFFSNLLSRSPSFNNGSISLTRSNSSRSANTVAPPVKNRSVSSQSSINRPTMTPSTSYTSTSSSATSNHARHQSVPPQLATSTSTSTSTSSHASISQSMPQAMVTPASPAPFLNLMNDNTRATSPISAGPSSSFSNEMRRSSSSISGQQQAPSAHDSVFAMASRPYTPDPEDRQQQADLPEGSRRSSSVLSRTTSPIPQSSAATTPTSRAVRYFSRHFSTPSNASAASLSGLTAPNTPASRFEDNPENARRSPTPTRFFSGSSRTASLETVPTTSTVTNGKRKIEENNNPDQQALHQQPPPLSTIGLELYALAPQISIGRYGQPLCGAVLDGKYLLIGTTMGLDFLPLHREGNRSRRGGMFGGMSSALSEKFGSSSSNNIRHAGMLSQFQAQSQSQSQDPPRSRDGISSHSGSGAGTSILYTDENLDKKVRKPINLIKKTRFKQLVILSQRSNVLLAVAGRNDHVRVYALDSLRRLIERKMKEIDAKDGYGTKTSPARPASAKTGLGLSMVPPVPPIPGNYKGKGRAVSDDLPVGTMVGSITMDMSAGVASTSRQQDHRDANRRQHSPPPAYDQPAIAGSSAASDASSSATTSLPVLLQDEASTSLVPGSSAASSLTSYGRGRSVSSSVSTGLSSPEMQRRSRRSAHLEAGFSSATSTASSVHASGTVLHREHIASSPRSMRRAKSSSAMRRPSTISLHAAHNVGPSNGSVRSISRRGSAATVTPDTVAALSANASPTSSSRRRSSVATILPTSLSAERTTFNGLGSPVMPYTRRGSTAQMADMGQVTSENHSPTLLPGEDTIFPRPVADDSYEWIDSPGSEDGGRDFTFPTHPAAPNSQAPPVPPIPDQYSLTPRSRSSSRRRDASQHSHRVKRRMTPRSARTGPSNTSSDDEEHGNAPSSQHTPSTPSTSRTAMAKSPSTIDDNPELLEAERRQRQAKKNRRVSLADILTESRITPSEQILAATGMLIESTRPSTGKVAEQASPRMEDTGNAINRGYTKSRAMAPRSATAAHDRFDMASLAEFLNAGPTVGPVTQSSIAAGSAARQEGGRSDRRMPLFRKTSTSTSNSRVPSMEQRSGATSPVVDALLQSRPSSLHSYHGANSRTRLLPKPPQIRPMDQQDTAQTITDDLIDFLREGPPSEASYADRSGQDGRVPLGPTPADASASTGSKEDGTQRHKNLVKSESRSRSSLAGGVTLVTPPATPRTAPLLTRTPSRHAAQGNDGGAVALIPDSVRYRSRTRSDTASRTRGGNFILAADEVIPVPVSVTTPLAVDQYKNRPDKRQSLQPRAPTFRQFLSEIEDAVAGETISSDIEDHRQQSLSLQEMLFAESAEEVFQNARGEPPEQWATNTAATLEQPSPPRELPGTPNAQRRGARKRWSLLEPFRLPTDTGASSAAHGSASMQIVTNSSHRGNAVSDVMEATSQPTLIESPSQPTRSGMRSRSLSRSSAPDDTSDVPPATAPATISPPILKPRVGQLLDDESPPFGNFTPEFEQQARSGATNPDGTTITFTQQTSLSSNRELREVNSVASALNATPASATGMSTGANGNAHSQRDSIAGNLDYVKLARTKGSRFIRASETAKRTYLAVLCGDQGERIELFTGAKNVSLSLNRTFVLPETPRTIEFQLQGEDLLDLYLIYDTAIFALEPSTVRVREVGIQRNERRQARRERERHMRQAALLNGLGDVNSEVIQTPPLTPRRNRQQSSSETVLHDSPVRRPDATEVAGTSREDTLGNGGTAHQELPNTHPTTETTEMTGHVSSRVRASEGSVGTQLASDTAEDPLRSSHSSHNNNTAVTSSEACGQTQRTDMQITSTVETSRGHSPADLGPGQAQVTSVPYTTFQQLECLPQIPPSVLASSYTIPPTYDAVLAFSPSIVAEGTPGFQSQMFDNANNQWIASPEIQSAPASRAGYSSDVSSRSATPQENALTRFGYGTPLSQDATAATGSVVQRHKHSVSTRTPPLLSPVSLLANPAAKTTGPPGLFFVSKGRQTTNIVDGDGRSVIRKPISWNSTSVDSEGVPERYLGLDVFTRLEILTSPVDRSQIRVVAFGPTGIQAVELGHAWLQHSLEVIPLEALKKQRKSEASLASLRTQGKEIPEDVCFLRDVTFMTKYKEHVFFAERVGSEVTMYVLTSDTA